MPAIILPHFDPIAIRLGPVAIHWYALAYIGGIMFAWGRGRKLWSLDPKILEDFVLWATLGIVLGGRLGYVLFYLPSYYAAHPLEALKIWQGGMSFHGGLLGVVLAIYGFCRLRGIKFFILSDIIAQLAPVGIGLGRLANFINNELWGRPSDLPWAMVFPGDGGDIPRHPSQIYEFLLEGMILFIILWCAERAGARKYPGLLTGLFLLLYGVFRGFCEIFREPDSFMGYPLWWFTMGQLLSLPLIVAGSVILVRVKKQLKPLNTQV